MLPGLSLTKADYKHLADGLIQVKDDLKGGTTSPRAEGSD